MRWTHEPTRTGPTVDKGLVAAVRRPTDGQGGPTSGVPLRRAANNSRGLRRQNPSRDGSTPASSLPLMARLPRLCIAGLPHLVDQAGHNGRAVFLDAADRATYRAALAQASVECGVAIHAYGLSGNRVLLLVTPREPGGLSRLMQRVGRRYTAEFNRRHGVSGTLWAGRFRATVLEPGSELLAAMCHVESDAALAGDAAVPEGERLSSAAHHLGLAVDPLISDHALFWSLGNTPFDRHAAYRLLVLQPLPEGQRRRLDDAVRKGWAVGSAAFIAQLGAVSTRRLQPLAPGRPRKTAAADEA